MNENRLSVLNLIHLSNDRLKNGAANFENKVLGLYADQNRRRI